MSPSTRIVCSFDALEIPRVDEISKYIKKRVFARYFVVAATMLSLCCAIFAQNNRLANLELDLSGTALKEAKSFGPEGWSDVKLLIYMTTHLPAKHIAFLPCWKDAIERLDIFKYANLILYTSSNKSKEHIKFLPFQNTTIKMYNNPGYQAGAIQAMVDPFLENVTWFDAYDWVIRVNPDVLIRDDAWLMQTMLNQSVDMIVHECVPKNKNTNHPKLHTDFFAFRPIAVDRERLLHADRKNAETHFTAAFRHLYDTGRFAYVDGGSNAVYGQCRIAGLHSPVVHAHELSKFCPFYYNVSKESFY